MFAVKWVISSHAVDVTGKGVWDMGRYDTFQK